MALPLARRFFKRRPETGKQEDGPRLEPAKRNGRLVLRRFNARAASSAADLDLSLRGDASKDSERDEHCSEWKFPLTVRRKVTYTVYVQSSDLISLVGSAREFAHHGKSSPGSVLLRSLSISAPDHRRGGAFWSRTQSSKSNTTLTP